MFQTHPISWLIVEEEKKNKKKKVLWLSCLNHKLVGCMTNKHEFSHLLTFPHLHSLAAIKQEKKVFISLYHCLRWCFQNQQKNSFFFSKTLNLIFMARLKRLRQAKFFSLILFFLGYTLFSGRSRRFMTLFRLVRGRVYTSGTIFSV